MLLNLNGVYYVLPIDVRKWETEIETANSYYFRKKHFWLRRVA